MLESDIEQLVIELLQAQGYRYLSVEKWEGERSEDFTEVALKDRLSSAVAKINPKVPAEAREEAIKQVLNLPSQQLTENNEHFHRLLTDGVEVECMIDGEMRGEKVWLVDWVNQESNDWLVVNQYIVRGENGRKIPDVVILVNGLPLVVIELKNPTDEKATVKKAFTQLTNYKTAIPQLFFYNSLLVASDGSEARIGSLSADWSRFGRWRVEDEDKSKVSEIETVAKNVLNPTTLLDLIRNFTVFKKSEKVDPTTGQKSVDTIKIIAAYHQYYAVNKAVKSAWKAASVEGSRKGGVVWHTQGSGKSLSMVFFSGLVVQLMNNPTVVVITDRNDLDEQLFETFASSRQLLRQTPIQAKNRGHLKKLLQTSGGGIVFTTIQKFYPEEGSEEFEQLSDRRNIVVLADEAHRSQYGFAAKSVAVKDDGSDGLAVKYGFAKYLRDALPQATFVGFTGTPIEKEDKSTPAVFGEYVDIYDIAQAVEDKATVPIYYESRLAQIHLDPDQKEKIDREVDELTEGVEMDEKEQAKSKWAQMEAVVGHPVRLQEVAKDIVNHYTTRRQASFGKGMIVAMSRRIAVDLYNELILLRPDWHDQDKMKGKIKVIMTSSSSDPAGWQQHNTSKDERKMLAERFKNPDDPLELVIVRDKWLTGFDAPLLDVMYIDKLMRGHTLMQAIARVNRVYKGKKGGLVVDYIGFASDLKKALNDYTTSGGRGLPTQDLEDAIGVMTEKYEVVSQMFTQLDFRQYHKKDTKGKLDFLIESEDYILGLEKGKSRFINNVQALSKAFALCLPHPKAIEIREDVAYFQALKARLVKFTPADRQKSFDEIEEGIRQIIDKAIVGEKVIDVFEAAGMKKPDLSILDDEFLDEVRDMKRKNVALELLKKLLGDEIKTRSKRNMIQSRKFSEMLENAINRYRNNLLTSAEVIDELIKIAKEMKEDDITNKELGLSDEEVAFYDVLSNNNSAQDVLGKDKLRELALVLVEKIKKNASIDWTIRESVRAGMRVMVKRTLREFGYPPDMEKLATENVLKQAELMAEEWTKEN